jgi:putative phosphoesterase
MRIGILSDTHNQYARTAQAVAALEAGDVEALIHCGDLTSPEIVHLCNISRPSYFVFGNNDFDEDGLRTAIDAIGGTCLGLGGEIVLGGKRIAVTHGDSTSHFRHLLRSEPDYLLFGHTHVALNERDGPTRQINPGALHRAASWTVALLDLAHDRVEWIKFG